MDGRSRMSAREVSGSRTEEEVNWCGASERRCPLFEIILAAVLAVSVVSCTTTGMTRFESAPLFGMLYDASHRPCTGATIVLDGHDPVTSDAFGRFFIVDVERGVHRYTVRKPGYAVHTGEVDFESESQVLYVRMMSYEQLTRQAEQAIEREELGQAGALLAEARQIDPSGVVGRYLSAILSLRRGRVQEAKETLMGLLNDGGEHAAVYLLLADIYRRHLDRPDVARSALRRGFEQTGDPEIKRRLGEIPPL